MVTNGNISQSQMVQRQGLWLWPSTAAKFDAMNAYLVAAGYEHMVITVPYGAYRSLADQVAVKKIYGASAATPGYSNHGLARAWDIYNIEHYPTGVIPTAAAKYRLLIDAGNGAGGIESWHMHDADGIAPADSGSTPITNKIRKPMYVYKGSGDVIYAIIPTPDGRNGIKQLSAGSFNTLIANGAVVIQVLDSWLGQFEQIG